MHPLVGHLSHALPILRLHRRLAIPTAGRAADVLGYRLAQLLVPDEIVGHGRTGTGRAGGGIEPQQVAAQGHALLGAIAQAGHGRIQIAFLRRGQFRPDQQGQERVKVDGHRLASCR